MNPPPCASRAARCACGLSAPPAWAAGPLQRYALVVGANAGGADRPVLRYAVTDAERFARVLVDLGGVAPGNQIVLKQPKLRELSEGLDLLTRRVADARRAAARAAAASRSSSTTRATPTRRGCCSATIATRIRRCATARSDPGRCADRGPRRVRVRRLHALKGGRARPPFLVDESSNMRGHAFLTSSAESEAAQESDRIRASYFTHYLVSGFRGAADIVGRRQGHAQRGVSVRVRGDARAHRAHAGGAQHPSYDIKLSGTGDVVMTDVRQTTATLVIGEELEGRFFVRNAAQELVVELYKPRGRRVELAVEAGHYEVRVEREKGALSAKTDITDGSRVVLARRSSDAAAVEADAGRAAGRRRCVTRSPAAIASSAAGMWRSGESDAPRSPPATPRSMRSAASATPVTCARTWR